MGRVLQSDLTKRDGILRDITRIEVEVLDGNRCRWILWDGPERAYCALAAPAEYRSMLETIRIVLYAMADLYPWEEPWCGT